MREDARQRTTDFVKDLYAAGEIDAGRLDSGIAEVLGAQTEGELAGLVRSLPSPVAFTSPDRRLATALEVRSTFGRLRLTGHWQLARETHVSSDLGAVWLDLTQAEFDDDVIDLHAYCGCGNITILVPRGVGVQVTHHRGGLDSRLEPPVPGLPLIRLDATANIGKIRLRHPGPAARAKRRAAVSGR